MHRDTGAQERFSRQRRYLQRPLKQSEPRVTRP